MGSHSSFSVIVHPHPSPNRGACAYELGHPNSKNALVFIGGLGDGPHTVPYIRTVAKHLETTGKDVDFSVFELRLRSSFIGFGTSSLSNDVDDIAALVKYLRGLGKEKIVLFGHSTGCQDCIEYSDYVKHGNPPVDGFIMQGPVSDREAMEGILSSFKESIELAESWIAAGRARDCLPNDKVPRSLAAPISAYRFKSLAVKGGDDDYFSSDLDDATVANFWSRFNKPVLVLHSGSDEFVPEHVDQAVQNQRYQQATPFVSSLSGLIPDAGHIVEEEAAREWLGVRVVDFLRTLEK
ncbi:Esterase/lipase superfamily protein [Metarhizium album ARSEF 1941]|uniref:Esterase/lipase superfamily protein n=1 Tax=Metarhizium album (strain ARSEF 1941) TaxID=1081103 RepID=A0A0B2X2X1_METAS|nr:Esterase/lipase superfamily protein [Metarhizium album ARSEF 1941]KHO00669.1 Esterase/lipase superfamily protein [Metarhizium album ARSEF 1941]